MPPARDDMGISMFFMAARTEQVIQQRLDVFPARGTDLPDHAVTVAASANLTQGLAHGVGYGVDVVGVADALGRVAGQVSGGLPGRVELGGCLVEVGGDAATSPAARINSISTCLSDSWPSAYLPFAAAASTAWPTQAPRARPAARPLR